MAEVNLQNMKTCRLNFFTVLRWLFLNSSIVSSKGNSGPLFPILVLLLSVLTIIFCFSYTAKADNRFTISNVTKQPQFFKPGKGKAPEISFKLSTPAKVILKIYDENDYLVKTLLDSVSSATGDQKVSWDGTDDEGRPVPPGIYRYTIEAHDKDGRTVRSDLTDISGGDENQVASSKINTKQGLISYVLRSPSLVVTRLGLKDGGPLMRTLEFMEVKPAGLNQVEWDGFDNSGTVNISNHKKLNLDIYSYSLSSNSIVVQGSQGTVARAGSLPANSKSEKRLRTKTYRKIIRNHWLHNQDKCLDPELEISFPQNMQRDPDGAMVAKGPVQFTVSISGEDQLFLTEERFEVAFYVDFLFFYEEEAGYSPYNWTWDTQGIPPGLHYVTVNVIGYDGHIGSSTLKVRISQ